MIYFYRKIITIEITFLNAFPNVSLVALLFDITIIYKLYIYMQIEIK